MAGPGIWISGALRIADVSIRRAPVPLRDPGGHRWTFSGTISDVGPADWGGVVIDPAISWAGDRVCVTEG